MPPNQECNTLVALRGASQRCDPLARFARHGLPRGSVRVRATKARSVRATEFPDRATQKAAASAASSSEAPKMMRFCNKGGLRGIDAERSDEALAKEPMPNSEKAILFCRSREFEIFSQAAQP